MKQFKGNLRLITLVLLGTAVVVVFINSSFLLQEEIATAEQLLLQTQNTQVQTYKLRRHVEFPKLQPSAQVNIK